MIARHEVVTWFALMLHGRMYILAAGTVTTVTVYRYLDEGTPPLCLT
jgi:hypothetical protein